MRRILSSGVLAISVSSANAALIDRGNGLIYDSYLNITWLQDANYSVTSGYSIYGNMSWDDAVAWADSLEFAGHTEWRLPSNETLGSGTGVWCSGYCSDSEMGYMYHVNFGLRDVGGPISNTGPFINLEANVYWTGTANDWDPAGETAWEFSFATGNNYAPDKSNQFLAWAVHEGDIGAVIPLPAAAWLFVSGLLGLIGAAKCKKNI